MQKAKQELDKVKKQDHHLKKMYYKLEEKVKNFD